MYQPIKTNDMETIVICITLIIIIGIICFTTYKNKEIEEAESNIKDILIRLDLLHSELNYFEKTLDKIKVMLNKLDEENELRRNN